MQLVDIKRFANTQNCSGLTSVIFDDDIPTIGRYSFYGVGTSESPVPLIVPTKYYDNYAAAFSDGKFYDGYFTLLSSTTDITLAPAGYATYYNSALAVQLPAALSAKAVTGVDGMRLNYATVAETGGIVPAGTPVMLCGPETEEATTYTLTYTTGGSYAGDNLLDGTDVAITTETEGAGRYYKLTYGHSGSELADVFGWYWGAVDGGAFSIGAHRAWLALSTEAAANIRGFAIGQDVEPNAIAGVKTAAPVSDGIFYNLSGQRVCSDTSVLPKGIYIRNGKKTLIK